MTQQGSMEFLDKAIVARALEGPRREPNGAGYHVSEDRDTWAARVVDDAIALATVRERKLLECETATTAPAPAQPACEHRPTISPDKEGFVDAAQPRRAVPGTSVVCDACGCRWKKHADGMLQLYDAEQKPCVRCDNWPNPPLRYETPDDFEPAEPACEHRPTISPDNEGWPAPRGGGDEATTEDIEMLALGIDYGCGCTMSGDVCAECRNRVKRVARAARSLRAKGGDYAHGWRAGLEALISQVEAWHARIHVPTPPDVRKGHDDAISAAHFLVGRQPTDGASVVVDREEWERMRPFMEACEAVPIGTSAKLAVAERNYHNEQTMRCNAEAYGGKMRAECIKVMHERDAARAEIWKRGDLIQSLTRERDDANLRHAKSDAAREENWCEVLRLRGDENENANARAMLVEVAHALLGCAGDGCPVERGSLTNTDLTCAVAHLKNEAERWRTEVARLRTAPATVSVTRIEEAAAHVAEVPYLGRTDAEAERDRELLRQEAIKFIRHHTATADVEAAKAWNQSGFTVEDPLELEWVNADGGSGAETEALYACGYRDGYRRGVEAAMHAQCGGCRDGEPLVPGPLGHLSHHQSKQFLHLCNAERIRALLAQEDQRG